MTDTITLARVAITTNKDNSCRGLGLEIENTVLHGGKVSEVLGVLASSREVSSNMDHRSPTRNIKSNRQECRTTGVVDSDVGVKVFAPHDHGASLGSGAAEREFREVDIFRVQRYGVFSSEVLRYFWKVCLKQLRFGDKHQVRFIEISEVPEVEEITLHTLTIPTYRGELQGSLSVY